MIKIKKNSVNYKIPRIFEKKRVSLPLSLRLSVNKNRSFIEGEITWLSGEGAVEITGYTGWLVVAVLNTNEIYERESRRFANLRNINSPVQFSTLSRVVVKQLSAFTGRATFIYFFSIFFPPNFPWGKLIRGKR